MIKPQPSHPMDQHHTHGASLTTLLTTMKFLNKAWQFPWENTWHCWGCAVGPLFQFLFSIWCSPPGMPRATDKRRFKIHLDLDPFGGFARLRRHFLLPPQGEAGGGWVRLAVKKKTATKMVGFPSKKHQPTKWQLFFTESNKIL